MQHESSSFVLMEKKPYTHSYVQLYFIRIKLSDMRGKRYGIEMEFYQILRGLLRSRIQPAGSWDLPIQ